MAGWFAAKRSVSRTSKALWQYANDFHQDLNGLLSDPQTNPQILMNGASGTDRDTAETYIALGNYYRQRGDMERALLMHQSVVCKEELSESVRAAARFELARDYDSAGLLDRSEAEFRLLIDARQRTEDAYASLLQLHERQRDWHQAIKIALNLQQDSGENSGSRIAHYYCELAQTAVADNQLNEAGVFLQLAIEHDPLCARALIMQAEIALGICDFGQAGKLYERVEQLRPELMPEIIENWFEVYKRSGDQQKFDAFLLKIQSQKNAYSVIRSTREVIALRFDAQTADRFFKDQILRRPSLKGLRDWAHDQLELSRPGERDKVQIICDLLDKVMEDKPAYRCCSCGFQGNVMHWRCPRCGQWDTVSTIIGVEGE